MTNTIVNGTLTIFLEGELNSYNSESVEKEIEALTSKGGFDSIVLDLANLRYISSAGLRIIVRLKQQFDKTSITNAQDGVYEIFEMVGFQQMLDIKRA